MLTFFQIEKTFYKFRVSLYVDTRKNEASATCTYDRRIVWHGDLPKADWQHVRTPELAERWLSRPAGERGNWIEAQEAHYRHALDCAA